MTSALVPMWILGANLVALIVLHAMFNSGTSAMPGGVERGFDNRNTDPDGLRTRRGPGAPLAG